jgi:hypothetical protein
MTATVDTGILRASMRAAAPGSRALAARPRRAGSGLPTPLLGQPSWGAPAAASVATVTTGIAPRRPQEDSMLHGRRPLPTIPASDLGRARAWYADKLDLTPDQEEPEALLYQTGGDRLFLLFSSPGAGTAQHQLAAWVVEDLAAEVAELRGRSVVFEDYDLPGLRTVDGVATTPVGMAAWFKDSEGNMLTMIQLD